MGGLLMVAALPLMLLGGLALDAWTADSATAPADEDDQAVGEVPEGDDPPLI